MTVTPTPPLLSREEIDAHRPDLTQSIAGNIAVADRAVVVPPPKDEPKREGFHGLAVGAVTAEGAFIPESMTYRGADVLNCNAQMPPDSDIVDMPGTYMFGGIMFGHFGHSLVETMARLWALDVIEEPLDGLLFIPKAQHNVQRVLEVREPLYRTFGVRHPMVNLEHPVRVDRLYVPQQGFGVYDLIKGAPEFRDYIRKHAAQGIEPKGPKHIYISRTQLTNQRGGLLGEAKLEGWLQEMGYTPYYPEKHSIEQQIATYRAADYIISMDGSPLHLLAIVGRPDQKVACISRRKGAIDQMFIDQFKAFQGTDLVVANTVCYSWVPMGRRLPAHLGIGEVSFPDLWAILRQAEMIPEGPQWPDLTPQERRHFLEPLETFYKARFIRTRG